MSKLFHLWDNNKSSKKWIWITWVRQQHCMTGQWQFARRESSENVNAARRSLRSQYITGTLNVYICYAVALLIRCYLDGTCQIRLRCCFGSHHASFDWNNRSGFQKEPTQCGSLTVVLCSSMERKRQCTEGSSMQQEGMIWLKGPFHRRKCV